MWSGDEELPELSNPHYSSTAASAFPFVPREEEVRPGADHGVRGLFTAPMADPAWSHSPTPGTGCTVRSGCPDRDPDLVVGPSRSPGASRTVICERRCAVRPAPSGTGADRRAEQCRAISSRAFPDTIRGSSFPGLHRPRPFRFFFDFSRRRPRASSSFPASRRSGRSSASPPSCRRRRGSRCSGAGPSCRPRDSGRCARRGRPGRCRRSPADRR